MNLKLTARKGAGNEPGPMTESQQWAIRTSRASSCVLLMANNPWAAIGRTAVCAAVNV